MDQRLNRLWIETETFVSNVGDELRARLPPRIKKLLTRFVRAKMRLVFRREKRRLVMIEPPRQLLRRRILEIDDRILVGIKHRVVEEIAGPVQQPGVIDLGFRMDAFLVEASESGRRRDAVEAVAVVEKTKFHAQ